MVKKEKKVIRYSEIYVNIGYNLQPVHNELALCVQWDSIFFEQSVQGVLVLCFTSASFCCKRNAKKGPWNT